MTSAQISAFQANSSIAPAAMATVIVGLVFAVLLLWGPGPFAPPTSAGRKTSSTSVSSSASSCVFSRCTWC